MGLDSIVETNHMSKPGYRAERHLGSILVHAHNWVLGGGGGDMTAMCVGQLNPLG